MAKSVKANWLAPALLLSSALLAGCSIDAVETTRPTADVLIMGGTIHTGDDTAPFVGDIAMRGDKILFVGAPRPIAAKRVIDARGMIVSPGLIDAHAHPDTYIRSNDPQQRLNAPWLTQGVSTIIVGVDGSGTPDVKRDIDALEASGIGTNLVPFIGFGAVRSRVIGKIDREPTAVELEQMKALVVDGMCQGATGLSTGLFYAPQSFAKTGEIIALTKEIAPFGGLYDTHQRDESSYSIGLLDSVAEALRIGREAGVAVHFAHLKALGVDVHGQAPAVIAMINEVRATGMDVTADQYPWKASGTNLEASLVPRWALDGGYDALIARLDEPEALERIRDEMRQNLRRRGGEESLLLTSSGRPWTGRTLGEMAKSWNVTAVDAAIRIMRDRQSGAAGEARRSTSAVASFNMIDADIDAIMQQPWVITGSDGSDGHPRQYATFPEKYAVYVRQRSVIDLASFIRRSTGLAADIYRLDRRGYLRPGYFADVLVFDPDAYRPHADYLHPQRLSSGVRALLVNGEPAVLDDHLTGIAAGRGLLRANASAIASCLRPTSKPPASSAIGAAVGVN